ncbi:GNAT family N-acetyltransferase [Acidimangrovimonas pyrenivorans]|uniref:GNAT family N-acetyltransferase n=1 Tax=Acidimangrovimonas pyrenivorans TaxID=2030798 RepID=A0ABV7AJV9_9RHOB
MTSAPLIRIARAADLAAIDALFARSYGRLLAADYPPSIRVTAIPLLSRAQPRLVTSGRYYVAVGAEGTILGAGGWSPAGPGQEADPLPEAADVGRAHVRHLVTDAGHTRRGIGRALMGRVFAEARTAGIHRLDCLATRTAVPFYSALGFVTLGPVEVALRPGIDFPAIRMQRLLE